mmetsp:Transcript_6012/g.14907  ORF Transcript_6012/g.14907 Transcript_6012/m.14907 type:complete len:316 (+) Transcript_6012:65-1012(+)
MNSPDQEHEVTKYLKRSRLLSGEEKKVSIIQSKGQFPCELRTTIDDNQEDKPDIFLKKIEKSVKFYILCLLYNIPTRHPESEKELEVAIRFFPNILSSKQDNGMYPIVCLLNRWAGEYNIKTVRFIPMFAVLGIEFGQFSEKMRGGLLTKGNLLNGLATISDSTRSKDDEVQQNIDEAFLSVLKELRRLDLFRKEDIVRYDLIGKMFREEIFPVKRFRYLADWDPSALDWALESSTTKFRTANKTAIRVAFDTRRMLRKRNSLMGRPPLTITTKCKSFAKLNILLTNRKKCTPSKMTRRKSSVLGTRHSVCVARC